MIRRHTTIFLAVIFAAALCGCEDSAVDRRLDQADAVMEQAPDSALAIIENIDTAAISSRATRARHALLLTQARVKTDVPVTSDSLISLAADYFADNGPDSLTMRAMFYKGWISNSLGDFTGATNPAMQAREIAINSNDNYWRAKSAELLCFIFTSSYLNNEALNYSREASIFYDAANRRANALFAKVDVAAGYANLKDYRTCIRIADSIIAVAGDGSLDSSLIAFAIPEIISAHHLLSEPQNAMKAVLELEKYSSCCQLTLQDSLTIAEVKALNGDDSLADSLLVCKEKRTDITPKDKGNFIFLERALCNQRGDYKRMVELDDRFQILQDSILRDILKQSVLNARLDHYKVEKIKEQYRKKQLISILLSVCFILLLIIVCGTLIYKARIRYKNLELEKKMEDILSLSEQIKEFVTTNDKLSASLSDKIEKIKNNESEIESLNVKLVTVNREKIEIRQAIGELFRDKWEILNSFCNEFFCASDSDISRKAIIKNVEAEISKIGSRDKLSDIESAVDCHFGGIITELKSQCQFLKPSDITFLSLICWSNPQINLNDFRNKT